MKTWIWWTIGFGAAAVAVTGVGVAEHYAHASPAQPPPASLTAVVTDPNTIKQAQTLLANAITSGGWTGSPNTVTFTVNGNAQDPNWIAILRNFQSFVNTQLPTVAPGTLPPGFPSQLRTDGVLDYATYIAMVNA